jgi:hypothetical protein
MNQYVGSRFKMRWLPQTCCAQSARLLFAASVRKQAGNTNLENCFFAYDFPMTRLVQTNNPIAGLSLFLWLRLRRAK